jgi:dolichyl-phosphate beta-glucosyltransferase
MEPRPTSRAAPPEIPASRGDAAAYPRPHFGLDEAGRPALSVVVPAYNEEGRIGVSLEQIHAYLESRGEPYELIVVDDGSTDATIAIVERFAADRPFVELVRTSPNRGKGHAVRTGVLLARGEFVLFTDADLSTPIAEIERLLSAARSEGRPIAVGSRAAKGAVLATRQPWYRELAGRGLNHLVRAVAVPRIRDTQCGFKLFRRDVAEDLFSRSREPGFGFDVEVLHLAYRRGHAVAEVPVEWRHQEGSKVRLARDSARMLATLSRILWRRLGGRP